MKNAPLLAAALLTAALPFAAHADEAQTAAHVSVSARGLDLTTTADAQQMLRRIERAARAACGPAPRGLVEVNDRQNFSACVDDAVAGTVAAIDAPRLTAQLESRARLTLAAQR